MLEHEPRSQESAAACVSIAYVSGQRQHALYMEKFYLRNKKDFVCLGKKKSKAELSL
jgi:hypothetical protein